MKDQINTIREALEQAKANTTHGQIAWNCKEALTTLSELEAMAGEPAFYHYPDATQQSFAQGLVGELYDAPHHPDVMEALYRAAPVAQQYEAGDMASAAAQGFRDGVASVAQQPLTYLRETVTTAGRKWEPVSQQPQAEAVPSDVVRDAERYRWLRVCNLNKFDFVRFAFDLGDQHLDNAIDIAIAQHKEKSHERHP